MTAPLVLVTGGAGFLGSHLCDRLLARGDAVLVLDDFSTGDASHLAHLAASPHRDRFTLRQHDIAQPWPADLPPLRRIYNLACPASPAHYQRHPVQTTLTSTLGMWHALEAARRDGARVLQASTSEVYGDPEEHPQAESYRGHVNPIGPRACYDEGKRVAETLCMAWHREHGSEVRIVRLFNSYGPRLRPGDGRVVSNFIVQALRGEPLTVYGDGSQTRSFCYVDDTVDGLLRMMDSAIEGPINLGNPVEHTVLELAELVLRLTGSRSAIERRPLPPDDPKRRRPDISRAGHHLQWSPRVSLEDGLRETIAYFRQMPAADAGSAQRFSTMNEPIASTSSGVL
ncbi:UDP-glucuronic acid decarboxylase family protein [Rhizobacter sp. SG703]|uniref:UDP-glucuronic acid decarboxylase family protein n=1 Tax=Rhizobacter sp. SG703 TaxID=2587140 RepID=UPI0014489AB4|nr:UDP-glucuronic acid decarboxylase family protein [Rhizobacter sp. SG703]NKI92527.1 UDP-glucuronate decarboxylase [Rhizobacter sp. SG703]